MRRLLIATGLAFVLLAASAAVSTPTYAAPPADACPAYYLCFWKDTHYSGPWHNFYYCGFDRLSNNYWSGAFVDSVNNDASSLVNNQTSGTISVFWDDILGGGPSFQQHSYGYRDNLVIDGWNDRISRVLVC